MLCVVAAGHCASPPVSNADHRRTGRLVPCSLRSWELTRAERRDRVLSTTIVPLPRVLLPERTYAGSNGRTYLNGVAVESGLVGLAEHQGARGHGGPVTRDNKSTRATAGCSTTCCRKIKALSENAQRRNTSVHAAVVPGAGIDASQIQNKNCAPSTPPR